MIKRRKSLLTKLVLTTMVGLSLSSATPRAEAFSIGSAIGAVIGVSAQYAAVNEQISYYNNEGRDKFLQQTKQKVGVNYDATANAQLARIMQGLSRAVAVDDPSIKEKPYNYFVNDQKTFNAFCTLGHNMSVNIGLFQTLNYNEDEIAFVVAHEMGHGQHNDPASGAKKAFPLSVLTAVVGSQVGNAAEAIGVNLLNNLGNAKLVTLPMEKNADKFAFQYAPKAGYNPGAGSALWQRVIEKMSNDKESFLGSIFNPSDHPGNLSRRDTYSKNLTSYSNNKISVDGDTGVISLAKKPLGTPAATSSMSSLERAYLIAGNMATVYHDKTVTKATASTNGSEIFLNDKAIMTVTAGDSATSWVEAINTAQISKKTAKTATTKKDSSTEEKKTYRTFKERLADK